MLCILTFRKEKLSQRLKQDEAYIEWGGCKETPTIWKEGLGSGKKGPEMGWDKNCQFGEHWVVTQRDRVLICLLQTHNATSN